MRLSKRAVLTGGMALAIAKGPADAAKPLIAHLDLADVHGDGGVTLKRDLSIDPDTGATTIFFDFPANWKGGGVAHYHSGSEEIYVIEGAVTLNGRDQLVGGSYLYRPGGIVHGHHESSGPGARFIGRTGSKLDFNYVREPTSEEEYVARPSDDGRPHILHLRTPSQPWEAVTAGQGRYERQLLSADRKTGSTTSLIRFPKPFAARLDLDNRSGWEWFVAAGEAVLDDGTVFAKDSYSNRPVGAPVRAVVRAAPGTLILLWKNV